MRTCKSLRKSACPTQPMGSLPVNLKELTSQPPIASQRTLAPELRIRCNANAHSFISIQLILKMFTWMGTKACHWRRCEDCPASLALELNF